MNLDKNSVLKGILTTLFILPLLCCGRNSWARNTDSPLRLSITSTKDVFFVREPIWIKTILTNVGEDSLRVAPLDIYAGFLLLSLTTEDGTMTEFKWNLANYIGHGEDLAPAESVYVMYDLLQGYGKQVESGGYDPILDVGEYRLVADYRPGQFDSSLTIPGVNSDILRFKVESPVGEEVKAFELLEVAHKYKWTKPQIENRKQKVREICQTIVERYPGSVIAPAAQYEIAKMLMPMTIPAYEYWDPDEAMVECRRMIENYPDYPETKSTVYFLIRCYHEKKAEDEGKEYLRTIIDKYKGTLLSRTAWEALDRWERGEIMLELSK